MKNKKFFLITITAVTLLLFSGLYVKRDNVMAFFKAKEDNCIPHDVLVTKEGDKYSVKWNTKSTCSGFVKYGEFTDSLNYTGINEKLDLSSTKHNVVLDKKWSTLYFIIISDNKPYGLGTSPMILN
jgi:hypothetical protein